MNTAFEQGAELIVFCQWLDWYSPWERLL